MDDSPAPVPPAADATTVATPGPSDAEATGARYTSVAGALVMGLVGPPLAGILVVIQVLVSRGLGWPSPVQVPAKPETVLVGLVLGALGTLLIVAIPRRFRWREMVERYAIRWAALEPMTFALMVAGSLVLILGSGALGSALVTIRLLPEVTLSQGLRNQVLAMERAPWPIFFAIGLAHALGPGIGEELMFRGHVQRGLRVSFSPLISIAATSALFAVWHLHPVRMILAFGGGCWLGWIAWRCDATGPGMAVHAVTNFLYFTGSTGYRRLRHLPEPTYDRWPLAQALLVFAVCALLAALIARVLTKRLSEAPDRRESASLNPLS